MEIGLWVVTVLLTVVFLGSGVHKIVKPRQALYDGGMTYVQDVHPAVLKAVGVLEVAGALGLVLPPVLERDLVLVPIAAAALGLLMLVATALHIRRREPFVVPLVLAVLAGALATFRLTDYPL